MKFRLIVFLFFILVLTNLTGCSKNDEKFNINSEINNPLSELVYNDMKFIVNNLNTKDSSGLKEGIIEFAEGYKDYIRPEQFNEFKDNIVEGREEIIENEKGKIKANSIGSFLISEPLNNKEIINLINKNNAYDDYNLSVDGEFIITIALDRDKQPKYAQFSFFEKDASAPKKYFYKSISAELEFRPIINEIRELLLSNSLDYSNINWYKVDV